MSLFLERVQSFLQLLKGFPGTRTTAEVNETRTFSSMLYGPLQIVTLSGGRCAHMMLSTSFWGSFRLSSGVA